jgi:hypothetical protein
MPSESGDFGLRIKAPHNYFEQNLHVVTNTDFRPRALLEHAHLAYLILLNTRPQQGYQTNITLIGRKYVALPSDGRTLLFTAVRFSVITIIQEPPYGPKCFISP